MEDEGDDDIMYISRVSSQISDSEAQRRKPLATTYLQAPCEIRLETTKLASFRFVDTSSE